MSVFPGVYGATGEAGRLGPIRRVTVAMIAAFPGGTCQTVRIGSPDSLDAFFVPAVVDAFHREAPGAKLEFRHLMMVDGGYEHGLESGFLDLVIV
ncbi:hypothetical protein [Paraburkholderia sp.]|uniref:hypothetical protein n=1 Tax=Paraburkholderia sp. TaxID=1926495 RepID=UPI002D297DC6|nr:hypothetical protein [Paraburkholderia sp.]HZZ03737.1 hypothetical protein [Paraburkholderia sp.]